MKTYHIVTAGAIHGLSKLCQEAHWVNLANGDVLVAAEFNSGQDTFESHPMVTSLPHPQRPNATLGKDVAGRLAELGVTESSNVWDVIDAASKLHPDLRFA